MRAAAHWRAMPARELSIVEATDQSASAAAGIGVGLAEL
jgi:hypothetical protein